MLKFHQKVYLMVLLWMLLLVMLAVVRWVWIASHWNILFSKKCKKNYMQNNRFHEIIFIICEKYGVERIPTRNPIFGYLESAENGFFKGMLNKAFLHFLPNFCHFWWFSTGPSARSTMKYHQKLKKSLVRLAFNPFIYGTALLQEPEIRISSSTRSYLPYDKTISLWRQ